METLLTLTKQLASWLNEADTDPDLLQCIIEYTKGKGYISMWDVCVNLNLGQDYQQMAIDQDEIGWRRFMEGMVC